MNYWFLNNLQLRFKLYCWQGHLEKQMQITKTDVMIFYNATLNLRTCGLTLKFPHIQNPASLILCITTSFQVGGAAHNGT